VQLKIIASWRSPDILRIALQVILTMAVGIARFERSFSKQKLVLSYLWASLTNNKSRKVVWFSFDKNRKVQTAKAYFDEIIDDFASIKARKVLLYLIFLCNLTGKGWIYLCFDGIVFFEHQWYMTCILLCNSN